MSDVNDKCRILALKLLEAKRTVSQMETVQMNYFVEAHERNYAAAASRRVESHQLLENLFDLYIVISDLSNEILSEMINMNFDEEDIDHMSRAVH